MSWGFARPYPETAPTSDSFQKSVTNQDMSEGKECSGSIRPNVSLSDLNRMLSNEYGLTVESFTELNSHEDRNFLVICKNAVVPSDENAITDHDSSFCKNVASNATAGDDGKSIDCVMETVNANICGGESLRLSTMELHDEKSEDYEAPDINGLHQCDLSQPLHTTVLHDSSHQGIAAKCEYLIKVMNDDDTDSQINGGVSHKNERLQLQLEVTTHLLKNGFVCPEVVPSRSGSAIQILNGGGTTRYLAYLVKYISGVTLMETSPLPLKELYGLGSLLAELHQCLKNVASPDSLLSQSPWSLENANRIRDHLPKAELDASDMQLVSNVLDCFSQTVLSRIHDLPWGIIHGDFHDENILVLKGDEKSTIKNCETNSNLKAKYGVIDFGDVSYSPYVFELAMAAAYFMMSDPRPDYLENVGHLLSGYFRLYKPTKIEIQSLFASVCVAFCRETVLATCSYLEQGKSNEYLMTAVDAGWKQLKQIWLLGQDAVLAIWTRIWHQYGLNLEL